MIAREWRCVCPAIHRDGFLAHLAATGVRETSSLPGYLGHQILERDLEDRVEVTLVTYWATLESIKAFAGEDIECARLYPGDEAYAIIPDVIVKHYRVVSMAAPPPA